MMNFLKNRKGQTIMTVLFVLFLFVVIWIFFVAPMLSLGTDAALENGATGLEAFIYSNLNLLIGLAIIVFLFLAIRFGFGVGG